MQPEGGTSWRKAFGRQGRSPRRSGGGRPEEVAGPELAPCLTLGLVHPRVPSFPSEPVLRGQGPFSSNSSVLWPLVPCGPEDRRRISVFFRSGTQNTGDRGHLSFWELDLFPLSLQRGGTALLLLYPCTLGWLAGGPPADSQRIPPQFSGVCTLNWPV